MSDAPDPWLLRQGRQLAEHLLRQLSFVRARCFRAVFTPEGGIDFEHRVVLADLRDFCFADRSPFSTDPAVTQRNIGRQEAWLRIRQHLALSDDDVTNLKALEVEDGIGR